MATVTRMGRTTAAFKAIHSITDLDAKALHSLAISETKDIFILYNHQSVHQYTPEVTCTFLVQYNYAY